MRRAPIDVRLLAEQIDILNDNLPVVIPDDEDAEAVEGILNLLTEIAEGRIVCFYKELNGNTE